MRRRLFLLGLPTALGACASALERPYVARQDWALTVSPEPAADSPGPARRGRKVLLVRSTLAAPGLGDRGLETLGPDGTMTTSFYNRWAVPPAEGVGASLTQFLAQSGMFAAVLAPGSLADADLTLEPELLALWSEPAAGRAIASLSIVLLATRSLTPRVLLQATETATAPLAGQDPESAVNAQLAALSAVFRKIEAALAPFA
ncbi:MAG TPA: ABC-type transport auxiliary lipoprotein family protein [Acetobacteraceae bacterium]|jgi:cholesterol transport system auxiliary component|nr:ABC-type transport auxiliary lipoprotein family protein [Acetobacteraceae bacterium]